MIYTAKKLSSGIHVFVTNRDSSLSGYDGVYNGRQDWKTNIDLCGWDVKEHKKWETL